MKKIYEIVLNSIYIIEGYSILFVNKITGKTRKIAKDRLDICNKCEFNKNGICLKCGCYLKAKVRVDFQLDENNKSIDGCPLKKW